MIQTILDTFHSFAYHCNLFANTYIRKMPVRGNASIMETEFNCFTESAEKKLLKKMKIKIDFSHITKLNYGKIE